MRRWLLAAAWLLGCSSRRLPEPTFGAHPEPLDAWLIVETPPPPVEAEEMGAPPGAGYVWLDGQWSYQPVSRRWVWEQGRWCRSPAGARHYARAEVRRERQTIKRDERPVRVVRWNEVQKRFERVDLQEDHWRWIRGAFYAPDTSGALAPYQGPLECQVERP